MRRALRDAIEYLLSFSSILKINPHSTFSNNTFVLFIRIHFDVLFQVTSHKCEVAAPGFTAPSLSEDAQPSLALVGGETSAAPARHLFARRRK